MSDRSRPEPPPPADAPAGGLALAAAARWARTRSIFLAALDLSEADRPAYVTHACGGDSELRSEVLSLLASDAAAGDFAETPAAVVLANATAVPIRLDAGARLGAYEVLGLIGSGGMGEVYRARHTVLGREVAIKTLSAGAADVHAKRRLLREARHASQLSHPNICTIHEAGEAEDIPWIVMELVDGRPLSELIRETVPTVPAAVEWGIGIVDALQHAHERGILHRDLKSSNVVLDGAGRPVVLDFGLSRRALTAGDPVWSQSNATTDGNLAGTLSHMAPEVLRGQAGDVRSDLWSLGCLLYELATGRLPFEGRTPFETSSLILREPPPPLRSDVPLALRLIIERCLHKDPAARYQSAADVRAALEAVRRRHSWRVAVWLLIRARRRTLAAAAVVALLAVPAVLVGRALGARLSGVGSVSALAVLPVENATGDTTAAFYAAGLAEALDSRLGSDAGVRVISPASILRASGPDAAPRAAARRVGAEVLLEARLREAGERVVVDVRLISVQRGRVLWSDTYERSARHVLALHADVVRAVAANLQLTMRPGADERLAAVRAVTPEAYEEFLRGRYEWSRRTPESLQRAAAHFTRAIELDATYAPAYAALADCYNQFGTLMVGTGSPREYRPKAAAAAIAALRIDPLSAEAHAALGYVRHYEWQWQEAEQAFRRAIELNPNYANARIWYANLLMSRRRFDEALEQVSIGRTLDPYSPVINTNVGWVLLVSGRAQEAVEQLRHTLEIDSTYFHARWRLADALRETGRAAEAYAESQRALAHGGRTAPSLNSVAHSAAALGRLAEARAIRAELLERATHDYVPPGIFADLYRLTGDVDSALIWTRRAFEERANWAVYLRTDTAAGPLQRDPRFRALLAGSGLER